MINYADYNQKFLFQNSGSPYMDFIIGFHHDVLFCICCILGVVFWGMSYTVYQYFFNTNVTSPKKNISLLHLFFILKSRLNHHTTIELIWTFLPIIILIIIVLPSFDLIYTLETLGVLLAPILTLKIIGAQWNWDLNQLPMFDFDKSEVKFYKWIEHKRNLVYWIKQKINLVTNSSEKGHPRLLTTNQRVILPTNHRIRFLITSSDVLHSLAIPSLGIKVDACPGRLNTQNMFIQRFGSFYGQCSEICGINHAFMPIIFTAVDYRLFHHKSIFYQNNFLFSFLHWDGTSFTKLMSPSYWSLILGNMDKRFYNTTWRGMFNYIHFYNVVYDISTFKVHSEHTYEELFSEVNTFLYNILEKDSYITICIADLLDGMEMIYLYDNEVENYWFSLWEFVKAGGLWGRWQKSEFLERYTMYFERFRLGLQIEGVEKKNFCKLNYSGFVNPEYTDGYYGEYYEDENEYEFKDEEGIIHDTRKYDSAGEVICEVISCEETEETVPLKKHYDFTGWDVAYSLLTDEQISRQVELFVHELFTNVLPDYPNTTSFRKQIYDQRISWLQFQHNALAKAINTPYTTRMFYYLLHEFAIRAIVAGLLKDLAIWQANIARGLRDNEPIEDWMEQVKVHIRHERLRDAPISLYSLNRFASPYGEDDVYFKDKANVQMLKMVTYEYRIRLIVLLRDLKILDLNERASRGEIITEEQYQKVNNIGPIIERFLMKKGHLKEGLFTNYS